MWEVIFRADVSSRPVRGEVLNIRPPRSVSFGGSGSPLSLGLECVEEGWGTVVGEPGRQLGQGVPEVGKVQQFDDGQFGDVEWRYTT